MNVGLARIGTMSWFLSRKVLGKGAMPTLAVGMSSISGVSNMPTASVGMAPDLPQQKHRGTVNQFPVVV